MKANLKIFVREIVINKPILCNLHSVILNTNMHTDISLLKTGYSITPSKVSIGGFYFIQWHFFHLNIHKSI